ncbi:MAG: hypothetical protein Rubg2KO_07200 [Rubricoccaceae bacterium]
MVEPLDAPDGVIAVRIEGPAAENDANADAVREALDAAPTEVRGLYIEVGWIWGDTPESFAALLRERFARLARRDDVDRVAFVSGSYPRRTLLRDIGEPVEGVEIGVFPAAARNAAMEWVSEPDRQPERA